MSRESFPLFLSFSAHSVPILTVPSLHRIQSQALKSSSPATSPGPFTSSEEPELGRGEARATLHLGGPVLRQPLVEKSPPPPKDGVNMA